MKRRFRDRADAGRQLADRLPSGLVDPIVLALPRGGVPVAGEVAARLAAPLDVLVARKIGAPGHEELGIGAIAEGGAMVASDLVRALRLSSDEFEALARRERVELERRVDRYRAGRRRLPVRGRDVVLVDDGLATGVTAEAALLDLRAEAPRRLVLAVPVCSTDTARRLVPPADEVVWVLAPRDLVAVGVWYDDFTQTTDAEVVALLDRARGSGVDEDDHRPGRQQERGPGA
ncbi:MAG: phosphoribosyltransferase [Acidimicrobiales bacterium]